MMWKIVVLVVALTTAVFAQESTSISQCVNNPGELPLNTHIEGCVDPPCLLPQLEDVVLHIVFKTPSTIRRLRTLATAYMILGPITVPIPYDLEKNAETCNFLTNSYCPVLENEVLQYTLRMYIEPFFPVGTAVTLEFRVVDADTGNAVLCIRVPIRIEPPRNRIADAGISQKEDARKEIAP